MNSDQPGPGTDIVAAINSTGVPATVKGKVQRAIFRMIAGGIGLEYWDKIRDNLDTLEGRTRVNMMLADEVGRQAVADPAMFERAKARFLGDLAQKQENIEAVAREAQIKIESSVDADESAPEDAPEPSQDWMNAFIREAELASSDDLRERLASVLAGEARKPGTFSRSTVRFIAEVEKETLDDFSLTLRHRVDDFIVKDKSWSEGEWYVRGIRLEAEGLLTGASASSQKTFVIPETGSAIYPAQQLALVVEGQPGTKKSTQGWLLTRTGAEVASLLPPTDEIATLQRLASIIDKTALTRIWLGPIIRDADGTAVRMMMVAWDKGKDQNAG